MNVFPSSKSSGPELSDETAALMLKNIFEACQIEPNEVPLDVLTSYSNYRKERYELQRWIIIIAVIAWILVPMLFISPKFSIAEKYAATGTPKYEIYVHTMLPVTKVTAQIDQKSMSVYEMDPHNFSLQPMQNGPMEISVTLFNKQFTTNTVIVDSYDDLPPVLIANEASDSQLTLTVEDGATGIDYANIRGLTTDGTEFLPISYDSATGAVIFDYPTETIEIFIPDILGNTLHLRISLDES